MKKHVTKMAIAGAVVLAALVLFGVSPSAALSYALAPGLPTDDDLDDVLHAPSLWSRRSRPQPQPQPQPRLRWMRTRPFRMVIAPPMTSRLGTRRAMIPCSANRHRVRGHGHRKLGAEPLTQEHIERLQYSIVRYRNRLDCLRWTAPSPVMGEPTALEDDLRPPQSTRSCRHGSHGGDRRDGTVPGHVFEPDDGQPRDTRPIVLTNVGAIRTWSAPAHSSRLGRPSGLTVRKAGEFPRAGTRPRRPAATSEATDGIPRARPRPHLRSRCLREEPR
jgi:hypothetical protein